MTRDKIIPRRERMKEDMRIRGMVDKARKFHIRTVKHFGRLIYNRKEVISRKG